MVRPTATGENDNSNKVMISYYDYTHTYAHRGGEGKGSHDRILIRREFSPSNRVRYRLPGVETAMWVSHVIPLIKSPLNQ